MNHFGPQNWWPAKSRFEMMVGAILMHQTRWEKVEMAISNLKEAGTLNPKSLARVDYTLLARLVRPAGLYKTKPRRLIELSRHLVKSYDGDLDRFFSRDTALIRNELLSLEGIGPETADSIILYAAGRKSFVVDNYTKRIGWRIGLFNSDSYDDIQACFANNLPSNLKTYQEFHALIVALAKGICRPRPLCDSCPLTYICDHFARKSIKNGAKNSQKISP